MACLELFDQSSVDNQWWETEGCLMTKEELIAFEDEIAEMFNAGKIRAPVHLYSGNEEQIINVFRPIRAQDWVFCSWRSHYQCLLKGVPKDLVRAEILAGRSISLCFPEHRIYSSAIVGGVLPIAVGAAMSIKRRGEDARAYCFVGDMTAETGIAYESIKYSRNHRLPIHFIVEDNEKSVCTNTREVWNQPRLTFEGANDDYVSYYHYQTKYPHAGAGVRVQF
jgi:pyruvate dehydrogenase E1 component alpha subunit